MSNESDAERLQTALEGKELARIMASPGYDVAMNAVRNSIVNGWEAATDPAAREQAWHLLQALKTLEIGLKTFASNGVFDYRALTGRN
jgi:hypothetical protein